MIAWSLKPQVERKFPKLSFPFDLDYGFVICSGFDANVKN